MGFLQWLVGSVGRRIAFCVAICAGLAEVPRAFAEPVKIDLLHIGSSGGLMASKEGAKEKGALETLRTFIKDETGFDDEIVQQKDWQELADKMAKGKLQLGVFQGYEFAWARERHPDLKPLALAVNVYRYPVAYIVTRRASPVKDFAGLKGKSLYLPDTGQPYLRLFVEHESQTRGKDLKGFFSKLPPEPTVEDGLDDVVDGIVEAAVVERASLEAYKRRKPARFAKLKEVAKSKPLPPVVVAYYGKNLDEETLQRFREGLLNASNKEKGRLMLTLFRLTGFAEVPKDFEKVLAETRKTYPVAKAKKQ